MCVWDNTLPPNPKPNWRIYLSEKLRERPVLVRALLWTSSDILSVFISLSSLSQVASPRLTYNKLTNFNKPCTKWLEKSIGKVLFSLTHSIRHLSSASVISSGDEKPQTANTYHHHASHAHKQTAPPTLHHTSRTTTPRKL